MIELSTRHQQKIRLYDLFAQIGKTLSSPGRLELLDLLTQAPRTVEELAAETGMSISNTSQHLQRLKQAHLVETEREGTFIHYRLADPTVSELWHSLRLVAEKQLTEVDQALDAYRDHRHEFERISVQNLHLRLQTGDVVLLDARPLIEYQTGHLPGALSVPVEAVEEVLASLPDDKTIVAYCRGPYCVLADEVLAILAQAGRRIARLEEGVTEWQMAGFEVSRV
jgi:DNA-binding transcriptional ArsR family regulator